MAELPAKTRGFDQVSPPPLLYSIERMVSKAEAGASVPACNE